MNIEEKINEYIERPVNEEDADKLARWGKSFGENHGKMPDEAGFHALCVEHVTGKIDDAPAYCAAVKSAYLGSDYWRGKGKTAKQVAADVKKHPNIKRSKEVEAEIKGY